jgi:hypothetical protein
LEPGAKANAMQTGQAATGARISNIAFDVAVTTVDNAAAGGGPTLRVAGAGAELHAKGEPITRLQFSLPIALPEARARRPAAKALDSEFLQSVDNGDSTWLPAR